MSLAHPVRTVEVPRKSPPGSLPDNGRCHDCHRSLPGSLLSFPYTRADVVRQCYAVATACANPASAAPALAESLTVSIVVHRLHRDELLRNLQTLGVAAQRQPATQVRLVLIDNSDASELGEGIAGTGAAIGLAGCACFPVMATRGLRRRAQPRHPRVGRRSASGAEP